MRLVGILIFVCSIFLAQASIGCVDDNGNAVDWWIMLKYPKLTKNSDIDVVAGMAYSYADSNSRDLQRASSNVEDSNGPLFSTLNQIYNGDSGSTAWIMYNDEKPTGDTPSSYGHSKGVVGLDSQSGFWLVHSVPKFPGVSSISYPSGGLDYGQSFLCISLDFASFNQVGQQLLYNTPAIYSSNLPSSFQSQLPNLAAAISGQWISGSTTSVANLTTSSGSAFTSFAKNAAFNDDLYESLVQKYYKTPMEVETWRNGPTADDIPSYCTPQYPYNSIIVDTIMVNSDIGWKNTKDHSKWAISTNIYNDNTVCIGDVNKQYSQFKRGGGTVCIQDPSIWKSFSSLINSADNC